MASLQARSPLRSAHPLFVVNKFVSLTAFIILLAVGWVALSYLKRDVVDRIRTGPAPTTASAKTGAIPVSESNSPDAKQSAAPARLVYSCSGDKDFYHVSTHLPRGCERTALSEEAAVQRGLKRCKACFPD